MARSLVRCETTVCSTHYIRLFLPLLLPIVFVWIFILFLRIRMPRLLAHGLLMHHDTQIVKWFWEVMAGFETEQLARVLQFVTGTSGVPSQGFAVLQVGIGWGRSVLPVPPLGGAAGCLHVAAVTGWWLVLLLLLLLRRRRLLATLGYVFTGDANALRKRSLLEARDMLGACLFNALEWKTRAHPERQQQHTKAAKPRRFAHPFISFSRKHCCIYFSARARARACVLRGCFVRCGSCVFFGACWLPLVVTMY